MSIVLACAAMALKDCVATFLNLAVNRGRAVLAGVLDAALDLAGLLVAVAGVGAVIKYGWTLNSVATILAMMVTSFFGTLTWTRIGRRIRQADGREEVRVARSHHLYGVSRPPDRVP